MFRRYFALAFTALVVSSTLVSCQDKPRAYSARGIVREVHPEQKKVRIAHEAIPDYMAAMTMELDVHDATELQGVQPGDSVSFRMLVTEKDGWIDQIKRLNAPSNSLVVNMTTNAPTPAPEGFRRVRDVEPLQVGDALPDYRFTNELGQAVSLGEFKGQALALTFIFTRCPFPTFCPRMSINFVEVCQQLQARANAPTNWHLFTLTFDPEFDTPAVLKGYAARYKADPARWNFLTGAMIDIDAISEQFGVIFWKENGSINHNLRTVVIDVRGRVHAIIKQNEWKPEDLAEELLKAAAVKP